MTRISLSLAVFLLAAASGSYAGDAGRSSKDDLGLVPLVHLAARWQAAERLALELEADTLAAPQGRAGVHVRL
jgi:hypothetical protein